MQSGAEVAQVLAELKVFGSSDLALVAKQFSGTVPVKKLLMIAEMAQQVYALTPPPPLQPCSLLVIYQPHYYCV
jgi:hypothetical protein